MMYECKLANGFVVKVELSEDKVAQIVSEWLKANIGGLVSAIEPAKAVQEHILVKAAEEAVVKSVENKMHEKDGSKKHWTEEEHIKLLEMMIKGTSHAEIARILGRTEDSVRSRASLVRCGKAPDKLTKTKAEEPKTFIYEAEQEEISRPHSRWSPALDQKLIKIILENGYSKKTWRKVSHELNRSLVACKKRFYDLRKEGVANFPVARKKSWTKTEEEVLLKEVSMRGDSNNAFEAVAKLLNRSMFSVIMKYKKLVNKKLF